MEERIGYLLQQRLAKKLTPAEVEELGKVLHDPAYDSVVTDVLMRLAADEPQGPAVDEADLRGWVEAVVAVDRVPDGEKREGRVIFLRRGWFRYAAAVLLVAVAGGSLFYLNRTGEQKKMADRRSLWPAIAPGGNKAMLRLADGSSVVLDSAADGLVTRQGGTEVIKSGTGQLAYTAGAVGTVAVGYNTITTPRGGQYEVQLPDGSKVWLNALSSVHFPTAFAGKSREVEVSGEAYFQIAKDAGKPFSVKVNGLSVEVLGTQFNINAYSDEPEVRTTLMEGAVRVRQGLSAVVLKPGQEARVAAVSGAVGAAAIPVANNVDLNEVAAWKNGLFLFNGARIETIMRQVGRWYGVDVDYKDKLSEEFVAEIPRNVPLSKLLLLLEGTGQVHFSIAGKKVTVMK
jgi:ferric-dicitrate binding protein FerR (iron transport regulator)